MIPRVVLLLILALLTAGAAGASEPAPLAPEFPPVGAERWINSSPLKMADLRGRVVLVEFWTYGCINCRRTMAWVKDVQRELIDKPFTVIGVHTPEFAAEHDRANVARKVSEFELRYPVLMDNDFRYWNAMGNRFWPAFYLIDGDGRLRDAWAGEVHVGTRRAADIESRIRALIQSLSHASP